MNDLELAAYLDRRLARDDRERIESHLASCAECRTEVIETRQLLRENRHPRRFLVAGLVAAAATLLLVVRPGTTPQTAKEGPLFRGAADPQSMVVYGPIGELSVSSPTFVWGAAQDASSYRLTLTTVAGATVWSVSGADTVAALADSVRLRPGEPYLWVVDALLDDGNTRSTGLHEFRITP